MRTLKTIVLLAISASMLLLASCNKDDDKKDYGQFTYDGTEYSFEGGFMENYGQATDSSGYNIDLTVYTSGVSVQEVLGWPIPTGDGKAIYLQMYSSQSDGFPTGTYLFSNDWNDAPFTFDYGFVINNPNEMEYIDFEDGTVTITKDGSNYEIDFNLTDVNGKGVTGTYKGTLKYYEDL
jgi:hypothetical protein